MNESFYKIRLSGEKSSEMEVMDRIGKKKATLLFKIGICTDMHKNWFGFYGISTFIGYLTPDPFLYK